VIDTQQLTVLNNAGRTHDTTAEPRAVRRSQSCQDSTDGKGVAPITQPRAFKVNSSAAGRRSHAPK
jgi:hypothetical protein